MVRHSETNLIASIIEHSFERVIILTTIVETDSGLASHLVPANTLPCNEEPEHPTARLANSGAKSFHRYGADQLVLILIACLNNWC